ncbi:MAG: 2-oxoacid:acceptor oxidoreductase family protein [Deltaproteobacteria bacterium]|nr:2-oxoacid:acceptor oxidoreductase family protein [Deltaproteobacteria bacterium]
MKPFNIYLCGVGGQGTGLLSEILLRGADHAGLQAKAVDTHGLAQRGGVVVSHLRIGKKIYSPMIPAREADLVVALERHEALRGADTALRDGGCLVYFNTVLQPLGVRLGSDREVSENFLNRNCKVRNIKVYKVENGGLMEPKMQNIAVLANIDKNNLIPLVKTRHLIQAMEDLMTGPMLEKNMAIFKNSPLTV